MKPGLACIFIQTSTNVNVGGVRRRKLVCKANDGLIEPIGNANGDVGSAILQWNIFCDSEVAIRTVKLLLRAHLALQSSHLRNHLTSNHFRNSS